MTIVNVLFYLAVWVGGVSLAYVTLAGLFEGLRRYTGDDRYGTVARHLILGLGASVLLVMAAELFSLLIATGDLEATLVGPLSGIALALVLGLPVLPLLVGGGYYLLGDEINRRPG